MSAIVNFFPAQVAGDTGWVWVIPVVFVVFLLFGIWTRSQGKGVVTTEKPLTSAGTERRSRPRPATFEPAASPSERKGGHQG